MIVAARAERSSSGGRSPGIVLARSVLPTPGGPVRSSPCPPASAISSARRAPCWPRTSARSGTAASGSTIAGPAATSPSPIVTRGIATGFRRGRRARTASAASARVPTPTIAGPPASRASSTTAVPTTTRAIPAGSAATIGSTPGTGRTSPPSDSSPRNATGNDPARTCSEPSRMPRAMARSSDAPPLRRSAGARLIVIRRGGKVKPALRIAPRTRSRASWSAVSARPTMVKPGKPGATSTSTRMNRPSRPSSVADGTTASTPRTLAPATHLRLTRELPRRSRHARTRLSAPAPLRPRWRQPSACRSRERNEGATPRAPSRPS